MPYPVIVQSWYSIQPRSWSISRRILPRMDWLESKELILFRHKCIKYKRCKKSVNCRHTILLTDLIRSSIMYSMNRLEISRSAIVSAFVEGNGVHQPPE